MTSFFLSSANLVPLHQSYNLPAICASAALHFFLSFPITLPLSQFFCCFPSFHFLSLPYPILSLHCGNWNMDCEACVSHSTTPSLSRYSGKQSPHLTMGNLVISLHFTFSCTSFSLQIQHQIVVKGRGLLPPPCEA